MVLRTGSRGWLVLLAVVLLSAAMAVEWPESLFGFSESCCSSWQAVVAPDRHTVVRARVGEQGHVQEHHAQSGVTNQVTYFPLTITDVVKPSTNGEKVGNQVQLWVVADEMYGATEPFRRMAGQEAVFLLTTTEGEAYPEGYSVYASVSYWTIAEERVTGGYDGIMLDDAPYAGLVATVHSAVRETSRRRAMYMAAGAAVLAAAIGYGVWIWRAARERSRFRVT